jgi:hypothetical protein
MSRTKAMTKEIKKRYPQHMIKCTTVEDREVMRKLIKKISGIMDKPAYTVVMMALYKLDKEI